MIDSDDPKDPNADGLEKHIRLDWDEIQPDLTKPAAVTEPVTEEKPQSAQDDIPSAPKTPGIIKQFYLDLIHVLTEPRYFFQHRYPEMSLSNALAFGVLVNWIAATLNWITRFVHHETLMDGFIKIKEKLQELPFWKNIPDDFWSQGADRLSARSFFPDWVTEILAILISPFQSLIHFCVYGFILFLGGYLLISKNEENASTDPVVIRSFVKLVCISAAPYLVASILGFLPIGLGTFIGWIYSIAILAIGMMVRFRISGLRALTIMVLPTFAGIALLILFLMFCAVLVFGLLASFFH